MIDISGNTSLYGIIGDPVAHSLSPLFQNYFIHQAKKKSVYLPFHVASSNLSVALAGLHASHIQGLNVTVPHKETILPMVNADSDAQIIGAVNTLKRQPSGWEATNTDWQGFASVLQGLNVDVAHSSVLLFGAGGTSRAICHALNHFGVQTLWICNRSGARAENLAVDLRHSYPNIEVHVLPWEQAHVSEKSQQCDIMINSSSIGLNDNDIFPFTLQGDGVAIDVVYKKNGTTAFTNAAKQVGFSTVDGLPMLIAQGIASFKFWHQSLTTNGSFHLPHLLTSLQWTEEQLGRQPADLPGWRTTSS